MLGTQKIPTLRDIYHNENGDDDGGGGMQPPIVHHYAIRLDKSKKT